MTPPPDAALLALASAMPEHMADAARACHVLTASLPRPFAINALAFLGMGSARTAGRGVSALASDVSPVPILIGSGYEIPACIGARSLVFATSGSGNTDEVHHAAAAAIARHARLVMVTGGGWLAEVAAAQRIPCVDIPPAIQPARATLAFVLAAHLTLLGRIGLLPHADAWIDDAIAQLQHRRAALRGTDDLAPQLAARLAGRHVLIHGDCTIGAVAAERWKAQINQSAKQPAAWSEQPDASHQEAVAWDAHMDDRSETDALVLLRHPFEDPRVARRMDLLAEHLRDRVPVHQVHGTGRSRLAALMDLILIGDVVALHMAAINGSDASSIGFISDTLKQGLLPPAMPRIRTA
jgi:glucose/mannose-6-phosphate isomerase